VHFGNINLPIDKRRIPLVTPTSGDGDGPSISLALAAVDAFEGWSHLEPRTRLKPAIAAAIQEESFVFGGFIPESEFQTLSIAELADGVPRALRLARGRILMVGGTWRADLGHGDDVDSHRSPVGDIRGMYLHANYIEALLDDRYAREVPLWFALAFDFVAGVWLYVRFHAAVTEPARLRVLIVPAVILIVSYVLFANLNLYLDFILPLFGCFAHLAVEYVRDYGHLRRASQATHVAGVGQTHGEQ
jgi:CHASE2 domain-containing sensor protein